MSTEILQFIPSTRRNFKRHFDAAQTTSPPPEQELHFKRNLIMKNTTANIALAIATLATGAAFAGDFSATSAWENFGKPSAVNADSSKTRDQVQAELAAYKSTNVNTGNFGSGLSTWAKFPSQAGDSGKSREQVQAELVEYKRANVRTINAGSGLSAWEKFSSKTAGM
jgi:hypothetical protein